MSCNPVSAVLSYRVYVSVLKRINHARTTLRSTEEGRGRGEPVAGRVQDAGRPSPGREPAHGQARARWASCSARSASCPKEDRGAAGKAINIAKKPITEHFAAAQARLEQAADKQAAAGEQTFDPTLPGPVVPRGSVHPVTAVQWEVEEIMARLGFVVVGGPEMETEYYNFEALNIPAMHPARDMQDTFWLTNGWLLRTHTSPCQVRAMERLGPPLRIIAPGGCSATRPRTPRTPTRSTSSKG